MILHVAVIASDGHVVDIPDHQSGTVVNILPVIIIAAGSTVTGGLAEIVELTFQNDVLIGSDGCNQHPFLV